MHQSFNQFTKYTWDFPDVIKFCVAAHTISQKAVRFRHPNYNPDRAQKLISSSMSRHLSTCNISSKSMHAFLSNLVNRQTDRQTDRRTRAKTFTCYFVGGKKRAYNRLQKQFFFSTINRKVNLFSMVYHRSNKVVSTF